MFTRLATGAKLSGAKFGVAVQRRPPRDSNLASKFHCEKLFYSICPWWPGGLFAKLLLSWSEFILWPFSFQLIITTQTSSDKVKPWCKSHKYYFLIRQSWTHKLHLTNCFFPFWKSKFGLNFFDFDNSRSSDSFLLISRNNLVDDINLAHYFLLADKTFWMLRGLKARSLRSCVKSADHRINHHHRKTISVWQFVSCQNRKKGFKIGPVWPD